MKEIFLDSDIILDVLLERNPFQFSPAIIFEKAKNKDINIYTSSLSFTNIFYVLRKSYTSAEVYRMLNKLVDFLGILTVDSKIVLMGLNSNFSDFEDSIQYYTAINSNMDVILTRNLKDYKVHNIPVMTADEFVKLI